MRVWGELAELGRASRHWRRLRCGYGRVPGGSQRPSVMFGDVFEACRAAQVASVDGTSSEWCW